MCAINGFNFKNSELIEKMNKITSHRGPDGSGIFLDEGISLGHNRLSIIDLRTVASQPMSSADGNLVITFNGEIYNFPELKKELSDYPFKTTSDTEVILAAYQKWGSDCVKRFNGMFAFAIWDKQTREIFLARDQIGIKPLYYYHDQDVFIFSSEIKAILEYGMKRTINYEALSHYLRILYVPEPLTMFNNIFKFPKAHWAKLKDNGLTLNCYWNGKNEKGMLINKGEIKNLVRETIQKAVKRQLVSDRPLGIFLSGGLDSSIVLNAVAAVRNNIDTFSVGFKVSAEEQNEKFNADFDLARRTAAYYKTNHHEVLISVDDFVDQLEKTIWHLDEPIANPTAVVRKYLALFTKPKVAVVLGGDGGDELFGGYHRYRLAELARYYQKLPPFLRRLLSIIPSLRKLNTPAGVDLYALFIQKDKNLKRVVGRNFLAGATKDFFGKKFFLDGGWGEALMSADRQSWLVDESLVQTDKMTMAAGLESRVPLLDIELIELTHRIPFSYKVSPFQNKIILKETFRGVIPDFLLNQPKRGWFAPAAKWLRRPRLYKMAQNILSPDYYEQTKDLFNWPEVQVMLNEHYNHTNYHLNILWALIVFQIWAKTFSVAK